jgi:uncharacterized protein (DUF427 family)
VAISRAGAAVSSATASRAMETKSIKLPGPHHPIEPNSARVTVSVADHIVADTRQALTLKEASFRQFSTCRERMSI